MKLRRRPILWLLWLLRIIIFIIDCLTPATLNVAFCNIMVSFISKDIGITRRDLWLMAFVSVAFALLAPLIGLPITPEESVSIIWFNRAMVAATILIVAYNQDKSAKAERELREAIRARDVFLATLAHELRNPLASIHNGIATMQRNPSPDESRRKLVEIIKRQVEHLVRLVDELLEISRIKGGKIKLRAELEDISVIGRRFGGLSFALRSCTSANLAEGPSGHVDY
jgi:signal transduction histidine kinase